MHDIKPVSQEEMQAKFPGAMAALSNPNPLNSPNGPYYCHVCDGLRNPQHDCRCWICGKPPEECPCVNQLQPQNPNPNG